MPHSFMNSGRTAYCPLPPYRCTLHGLCPVLTTPCAFAHWTHGITSTSPRSAAHAFTHLTRHNAIPTLPLHVSHTTTPRTFTAPTCWFAGFRTHNQARGRYTPVRSSLRSVEPPTYCHYMTQTPSHFGSSIPHLHTHTPRQHLCTLWF